MEALLTCSLLGDAMPTRGRHESHVTLLPVDDFCGRFDWSDPDLISTGLAAASRRADISLLELDAWCLCQSVNLLSRFGAASLNRYDYCSRIMSLRSSLLLPGRALPNNSCTHIRPAVRSGLGHAWKHRNGFATTTTPPAKGSKGPTAMVFLNMGGPSKTDEVENFLSRLFVSLWVN